ncbi:hypothetical protein [Methylophilus sp.]|uniref:hypothetical protein n=1 Tax=Methylophilus sp. TaxID=29541 RepID=UPI0040364806
MKTIFLLIYLALYPCFGIAATAHASLSNFRFEIISGEGATFVPDSFYSQVISTVHTQSREEVQDKLPAPYIYDISAVTTGGHGQAVTNISYAPGSTPVFSSDATATRGTADSYGQTFFSLNYIANSVIKISADAHVSGTAGEKDIVTTIAAIRGANIGPNGGIANHFEPNIGYASYPYAFDGDWSFSRTLSFTFSYPTDTILYFASKTYASVEINPYIPTQVPEPQSYVMAFLGLMMLAAKNFRALKAR